MEVLHEHCAGLDVHKKTVVACVLHSAVAGATVKETRSFSTMLPDLERLREWLSREGCTQAVMEATGVYWKPVYNVLESCLTVLVVNPEHVKVLSGRKTDVKDAEWLADLLRHGLLRASFIPERDQRDLRELTRFRTSLVQDRARAVNRLQKTLEGANIKLASVLSDVTGVSGQRILDALLEGEEDPEALAGATPRTSSPK
jgi:transposase